MGSKISISICLTILMLFGIVQADEPKPAADSISNRGSAGGSITSEKTKIPNWSDRTLSGKTTSSSQLISDSVFHGSFGPSSLKNKRKLKVRENPEKAGFPLGWNTNSDISILKVDPNGNMFIELRDSQEPLSLSHIIDIQGQNPTGLQLTYSSSTQARLRIFIFGPNNALAAGIIDEELIVGIGQSISVDLAIPKYATKLLLVIEKAPQGILTLSEVVVGKEVSDED